MSVRLLCLLGVVAAATALIAEQGEVEAVSRRLPPVGVQVSAGDLADLKTRLQKLQGRFAPLATRVGAADVGVYLKAVDLALVHGEFYKKGKDVKLAHSLLNDADMRLTALAKGKLDWRERRGLLAVGYRSTIDDSLQPYGLEIPATLDLSKPVPLYVWLHGRGDKVTDMHFIAQRQSQGGKFVIEDGIVVHPFGRQCVGYKHAGEIDVLDVIEDVAKRYSIDGDRVALMGFSMGGAGVWHIGAHFTDRFAVVHAGAGFAETAAYNRLAKEDYPPVWEQALWQVYDVPNYVRNLFNVPTLAYSGEIDKQIQAARVMEQAFAENGRKLPHLIGPKMGHKYDPATQKKVLAFVQNALAKGRDRWPETIHLQTATLQYSRMHWLSIEGLAQHWKNARVHATRGVDSVTIETQGVTQLEIRPPWKNLERNKIPAGTTVVIDGERLLTPMAMDAVSLVKAGAGWRFGQLEGLCKKPGLQGPMDDAFRAPFLVVTPDEKEKNPALNRWVAFELAHFRARWRALMRGEIREKKASEVTAEDVKRYNLILWGSTATNKVMARVMYALPLTWAAGGVTVGSQAFNGASLVPQLIYPNPEAPSRYVVLNSGLTFRENHDRTNSLQNPKLGDWAVIDYSQDPNGETPGKVVRSGFFNERWQ